MSSWKTTASLVDNTAPAPYRSTGEASDTAITGVVLGLGCSGRRAGATKADAAASTRNALSRAIAVRVNCNGIVQLRLQQCAVVAAIRLAIVGASRTASTEENSLLDMRPRPGHVVSSDVEEKQ